jgi:cell wall-associated NlpC family hydrolase
MALDGVSAVQARIQEIDQIVASINSAAAGAPAASTATASTGASSSSDFASMLTDALNNSAAADPLATSDMSGDATGAASGSSSDMTSLLSSLTGGGTGTDSSSDLTSLLSSLTGGGSSPSQIDPSTLLSALSQMQSTSGASAMSTQPASGSTLAQQFLDTALTQAGKPYVWGATASPTDPNPPAFDCSELTKWAAARVGDPIPDVASAQYLYLKEHGDLMSVQQALHTPGALLFHFDHEPKNLQDDPSAGHVAISVGDGVHTIEARGHAYGTNVFADAADRGFNYAGMIPGMS